MEWYIAGGSSVEAFKAVLGLLIILGLIGAVELLAWQGWNKYQAEKDKRRADKIRKKAQKHHAPFNYWM